MNIYGVAGQRLVEFEVDKLKKLLSFCVGYKERIMNVVR